MKKNYKKITIQCLEFFAFVCKEPWEYIICRDFFGDVEVNPLCEHYTIAKQLELINSTSQLTKVTGGGFCRGCVFADKEGNFGCKILDICSIMLIWHDGQYVYTRDNIKSLRNKAIYFEKLAEKLKPIPPKQFVPETWEYFDIPKLINKKD